MFKLKIVLIRDIIGLVEDLVMVPYLQLQTLMVVILGCNYLLSELNINFDPLSQLIMLASISLHYEYTGNNASDF